MKPGSWHQKPIFYQKKGKQIDCNAIIPPYYKINKKWIKFLPSPTDAVPPNVFKPDTKIEWTYSSINALATSGLYSKEDLNSLHKQMMFPIEKQALINTIARQMTGQVDLQAENISQMFSEQTLWNILCKQCDIVWKKLLQLGSVSSVIITILIIFLALTVILNTILRVLMLHKIYGFSMHLLGAIFSSVTQFLVMIKNKRALKRHATELREIKIIPSKPIITHQVTGPKLTRPPPPPIPNRFPDDLKPKLPNESKVHVRRKTNSIFEL